MSKVHFELFNDGYYYLVKDEPISEETRRTARASWEALKKVFMPAPPILAHQHALPPNINNLNTMFDAVRYISAHMPVKEIKFYGTTTVCKFHDGTYVSARPQKDEVFCEETGVAMCIAKYIYGSRSKFLKAVDKGKQQ
jgi:hypothetical protein